MTDPFNQDKDAFGFSMPPRMAGDTDADIFLRGWHRSTAMHRPILRALCNALGGVALTMPPGPERDLVEDMVNESRQFSELARLLVRK